MTNVVASVRVDRIETLFAFPSRKPSPARPCIELTKGGYTTYWPLVDGALDPLPPTPKRRLP